MIRKNFITDGWVNEWALPELEAYISGGLKGFNPISAWLLVCFWSLIWSNWLCAVNSNPFVEFHTAGNFPISSKSHLILGQITSWNTQFYLHALDCTRYSRQHEKTLTDNTLPEATTFTADIFLELFRSSGNIFRIFSTKVKLEFQLRTDYSESDKLPFCRKLMDSGHAKGSRIGKNRTAATHSHNSYSTEKRKLTAKHLDFDPSRSAVETELNRAALRSVLLLGFSLCACKLCQY